ncbi:MAG TPA: alpha/beta hydrolase [Polaromonas sp.]|uniref:alpha/beta fold hydrolase n=1 Tax=Polaromonas sp. TaxID=1869339 RepID=UPI002D395876|nr:alpha/beta hydrolase [Polaromonas sp.]HYW57443.1 alpha/beta hydrolase [Polaromonas sp.]
MDFVSIQGVQLEVQRIPGAPGRSTLVFLHDGLGSVSLWTQLGKSWPQAVCLATGRGGLVYSRRGYGHSDPVADARGNGRLDANYLHREAWEVLPQLLAAEGLNRPVLVGHSDGASIALLHASQHPVSAVIAMAPHVLVEDIAIKAIAEAATLYQGGDLRQRLSRHHADVDGAFWRWNDVWLSQAFLSFDIRKECAQITAPLLLVQGTGDEYGTMRQLDEIALAAPHAHQLRLAACAHSPHRDQPEKITQRIADFLQNVP